MYRDPCCAGALGAMGNHICLYNPVLAYFYFIVMLCEAVVPDTGVHGTSERGAPPRRPALAEVASDDKVRPRELQAG